MPQFKPRNRGFQKEKIMQTISSIQNTRSIKGPPKREPKKSFFKKIKEKLCQMFGGMIKTLKN